MMVCSWGTRNCGDFWDFSECGWGLALHFALNCLGADCEKDLKSLERYFLRGNFSSLTHYFLEIEAPDRCISDSGAS